MLRSQTGTIGVARIATKCSCLCDIISLCVRYFGHVARHPSLQNSITLGFMAGTRRQGGQRRQWTDDITDWAGLNLPEVVTLANERRQYRQFVHKIAKATLLA